MDPNVISPGASATLITCLQRAGLHVSAEGDDELHSLQTKRANEQLNNA